MPVSGSIMMETLLAAAAGVVATLAIVGVTGVAYFRYYLAWEGRSRLGMRYYGRPLADRRAFRAHVKARSRFLIPLVRLGAALHRGEAATVSVDYQGVYGPSHCCTVESFRKAVAYEPTAQDVFVVAQMRCGTTWMQQIVYEVLHRGEGDLSDNGHVHLCAVSPWLEAVYGVAIENAPLLGRSAKRLVKTHLPTRLCPFGVEAKYIYVTRHPLSCFTSIVEFLRLMAGPFAPPASPLARWYCSDRMWWLSWPDHVAGWWERSEQADNVLFVHFEEIQRDLGSVVRRVARFLGEPLREEEANKIVHKASFQYMKEREELFEMSPPNMFSVLGSYFDGNGLAQHDATAEADSRYILRFCKQKLAGRGYPAARFYPEIPQG